MWQRLLTVGEPLPPIPLALTPDTEVMIDLEATYTRAAADSYIT